MANDEYNEGSPQNPHGQDGYRQRQREQREETRCRQQGCEGDIRELGADRTR